jgi:hypothetical protein
MRRSAQGEIRHNSLRSAFGTYCVFPLHSALHLKAVIMSFAGREAWQEPDIESRQRTSTHQPTPTLESD